MVDFRHMVVSCFKAEIRSVFDSLCRLFPVALGGLGLRLMMNGSVAHRLSSAAIAQLQRSLASGDESGYRQECFSQEGEDLVLARIVGDKANGFFVDVGAHHPMRHSNTFLFYKRGWRGINIDATPNSMTAFNELRPRDINLERLIASETTPRTFHVFNEPALNTASQSLADLRPAENTSFKIIDTVRLQPARLASILDEYLPHGQSIDIMSVDVEGLDLDALKSNDWKRYRPKLLLVELLQTDLQELERDDVVGYLKGNGYRPIAKMYNTVIFLDQQAAT